MNAKTNYTEVDGRATCRVLTSDGKEVSKCSMYASNHNKCWHISAWYTAEGYKHHGYGKVALATLARKFIEKYGEPTSVEYTWNNENQYVLDWMVENFHAECTCPIVLLKNSFEDTWDSHIYRLNAKEFLDYVKNC